MSKYRHAPSDWQPGVTRVHDRIDDRDGVFVGNSNPLPGLTPKSWLGVLVDFGDGRGPVDVDPADLTAA